MKTRILLLGASGATGRTCLDVLGADPDVLVTVAGRNPLQVRELCASRPVAYSSAAIDFDALAHDGVGLVELALHADVVVNCAGPSHRHSKSVAAIVMMCGAIYIDPGMDRRTIDQLHRCRPGDGVAVVQTGVQPGISGLAMRLLARRLGGRVDSVAAWCGGLQPLTRAAVADYLAGLSSQLPGPVVRRAGIPIRVRPTDASAPPPGVFPPSAHGRIHLDDETVAAGDHIGAADIEWINMIDGHRTERLIQSRYGAGEAPSTEADIDGVCAAAAADLFGREQYFALLIRARRNDHTVSFLLRADDSYAVTGLTTAWAATHAHSLPAGIHPLSTLDSAIALLEHSLPLSAAADVRITDTSAVQVDHDDSYEQGRL